MTSSQFNLYFIDSTIIEEHEVISAFIINNLTAPSIDIYFG